MLATKILIHPSVSDFLEELPNILITEGYLQPKAIFLVTEKICQYTFFKRSKSPRTTWYIFFIKQDERILVKYITNNHKEGQYIR